MCEWWGIEAELEPSPGGAFRVVMGADGPTMRGEYIELHPYERLVFSFGWEGNPMGAGLAPGSTTVEVTFEAIGEVTEVLLRHSGLPSEYADEHIKGWSAFFGERLALACTGNAMGGAS